MFYSLKEGYQIVKRLSSHSSGKTFLALCKTQFPPIPCIIQEHSSPHPQSFYRLSQKLQILGLDSQIPTLIDTFEIAGKFYLIEEFIAGQNLATILTEEKLFGIEQIIQLLEDCLPILFRIHEQEIIHGDLKPTNLIYRTVANTRELVLVDFRSTHFDRDSANILADPQYAAPEQLLGKGTYASDLYSLGIICLHLLTGMPPFDLLNRPLPEMSHAALCQILQRLVEPNLQQRFSSAKAVLQAMQRLGMKQKTKHQAEFLISNCYAILQGDDERSQRVNTVTISPDGNILASGSDARTIRLWQLPNGEEIGCFSSHEGGVKSLAFSADSESLVSGDVKGMIYLWSIKQQALIQSFQGHKQAVNALLLNAQGQLMSGSADKTVKVWNSQTTQTLVTLKDHQLGITAIAFHPTLPLLATASLDRTIKFWDFTTFKVIKTWKKHTWAVRASAFSQDGKLLATGGDDNLILLWDVATGKILKEISGHSWTVTGLSFGQDGHILISSSWDKTIKLWQIATGKLMTILTGHTDSIDAMAVHPFELIIASGSQDGTIRLWNLKQLISP